MEAKQKQLQRIFKILRSLFKIGELVLIIGFAIIFIALIFAVVNKKIPNFGLLEVSNSTTSSWVLLSMGNSTKNVQFANFIIRSIMGLINICFYLIITQKAIKIFSVIIDKTRDFWLEVAGHLKIISYLMAVVATVFPIVGGVFGIIFAQNGNVGVDILTLILAIIFYSLSIVFEYVKLLSGQLDETL
ncbi:hypothetical protein P7H90_11625 [Lactococcus lactis]|jgi:hypothetical protein|uniref:hypothetical protein n=1 Tax=Lactococcus TaxID=1357 RepID=UPI002890192E|nr:hypothetical protein [Lactococcus lactis]MDT2874249.1 hypothetical protein [Lactococcus lactis]MDT2876868.1 hypothetical protein [Lactococcus lactis]MDT2890646.1 hypothetical protein [Lactococcus lactis]MDT2895779.1 hypothetical protein [Lactococcus lactis]MDT2919918.1 hypothetical protein [Lactococcus lactis]